MANVNNFVDTKDWKFAALAGNQIILYFAFHYDAENSVFWAESTNIEGIYASGSNIEELVKEIKDATDTYLLSELIDFVNEQPFSTNTLVPNYITAFGKESDTLVPA